MSNIPLKRRLTALQSGHLPQLILDYIEHDLSGASAEEIEQRVTPDYIVKAARRALDAIRQPPRPPAAPTEFPFIGGPKL